MPIRRFQKYNKYMLVDSGVGSDLRDILSHIDRAVKYIKSNPQMAVTELENMRQAFYLVTQEISPKYMAFAVLVKSIDGKPKDDLSDMGIKGVLDALNDVKKTWIDRVFDSVKKMDKEFSLYFPRQFESSQLKEYYDLLKTHTMLRLKHIMTGEDVSERLQKIEDGLSTQIKPKVFSGAKGLEIKYDKDFEDMCLVLSKHINVSPNEMTVLQFYIEHLKKEAKEKEKAARRAKRRK